MEGDLIRINKWLLPLSWLYGLAVKTRNALFDVGLLKSHSFEMPVIAVGNITVGGTGKTPHVEYLIDLLRDKCHVAVLSRGYKRKTRGFLIADDKATARTVGDEPYQMKQKFPDVTVAVDSDRCNGIRRLMEKSDNSGVDVVLLDDAFQHRHVKPGVNILLVDYHRLIVYDKLLPAGRLREHEKCKHRADIVIVTKCPPDLKPMEFRVITKAMNLFPYQELYFTRLDYRPLRLLFRNGSRKLDTLGSSDHVLLLTGIASPMQMILDVTAFCPNITPLTFSDHHAFSPSDVERINKSFADMPQPRLIITTEKDAARLKGLKDLSDEVRRNLYVLPVRIRFMLDKKNKFNEKIISYVRKNSRNGILDKATDDDKPKDSNNTGNRTRTISFRNNRLL